MATIVLVHGIAQEQRSAAELETEWLPSLAGGLENAGHTPLADGLRDGAFPVRMAFYGNKFLSPDHQGLEPEPLTAAEQSIAEQLALDLLRSAAHSSNPTDAGEARRELAAVTAEPHDAQGIVKATAVRAAATLDRIPWFGRGTLSAASVVNRTLAQVTRYLDDPAIHDYAIAQVNKHLTPETRVVIGHSLGSVVAYDTLRARPSDQPVPLLVTLGSPLGLSAISQRLQPQPPAFPAAVRRWVNIAAPDDVVAARRELHAVFDRDRPHDALFENTWNVDNGSTPHQINFYLTKKSCGAAVADALAEAQAHRRRPWTVDEREQRPASTGGSGGPHSSSTEPSGGRAGGDDVEVRGVDGPGGAGGGSDSPPGGPGDRSGAEPQPDSPRPRHLQAQLPERVETGRPLSLRVAITLSPGSVPSAGLKSFLVPPEGATVTVIVSAPGLVPDGDMQANIVVPADKDSEPHRFAFTAGPVGLHTVTVEAYIGGTFLGAVQLEVSVERSTVKPSEGKPRVAELPSLFAELGEVTLQVRSDPRDGLYRFQLLGDPMHGEVEGAMMGEADAAVGALVAELNKMAANKSRYKTPDLVRRRLKNLGIDLWLAALPQTVREQFWDQADRIKMFTIVTDNDVIPWELLYPADGSNDNGFLAEQFPVIRRSYAAKRVTHLPIDAAAYIVPPAAPSDARDEVEAVRAILGEQIGNRGIYSELSAVSDLMLDTAIPGIIHFACHNTFSAEAGSSIDLGGGPFTPIDLADAAAKVSLAPGRPLVFFNACRTAAEIPWFTSMSGWATRFVRAGAAAFIGSLWAVRSSAAKTFAEAFYDQFVGQRQPLGTSSFLARKAVSEDGGDPTWLAYSVYGNPAAVVEETANR